MASFLVTWECNNNIIIIYIDGSNKSITYNVQNTPSSFANFVRDFYLGALNHNGNLNTPADIELDEIGIWSRALTSAEVTQLYNGGTGISGTDVFTSPPTSTLNSPADDVTVPNPNVVFNATGTDETTLDKYDIIC